MWKNVMSIQYTLPGFEPKSSWTIHQELTPKLTLIFFIKLIYNSFIEITFRLENDFWQSVIRNLFHWPSRTTSIPGAISALLWRQTRTLRCLQSVKLFNRPWEKLQSSASRPKPAAWRLSRLALRLGDRLPMKEYKASRIRFVHNLWILKIYIRVFVWQFLKWAIRSRFSLFLH